MPSWTTQDIPPQTGRLALVTGATGGLGYETALALARAGAEVWVLGRNPEKGAAALARLRDAARGATLRFERLDLADLASVRACAEVILTEDRPIDLLVNNAGVMAPPTRQATVDGFEVQFGTNHLGHFLLTAQLLPLLRRGSKARVVNVASLAHWIGKIDFDDPQWTRRYDRAGAYGQSKLANLLFTLELQRRSVAGGWGVMAVAAHPGSSNTDLVANGLGADSPINRLVGAASRLLGQPAADGALPILFAGVSADVEPGGYYGPSGFLEFHGAPAPAHRAAKAKDVAAAKRLWALSAELTGAIWPALV